jgi:hypothetical protein
MQHEIAGASILGFVPTRYPAGIILAERWDGEDQSIVKFTATVEDVESAWHYDGEEILPRGADLQWGLIERASRA